MGHFAQLDDNNIVINVIRVEDDIEDGNAFLGGELGLEGTFVKTSYNTFGNVHRLGGTPLRKNYAYIGGHYDPVRDAFYEPQPHPSWILDEETCIWIPPVPNPDNKHWMQWDEENQTWLF